MLSAIDCYLMADLEEQILRNVLIRAWQGCFGNARDAEDCFRWHCHRETQKVEYFSSKREETAVEDYGLLSRPSTDHGDDKVGKVCRIPRNFSDINGGLGLSFGTC
jgi:hypothetical protein